MRNVGFLASTCKFWMIFTNLSPIWLSSKGQHFLSFDFIKNILLLSWCYTSTVSIRPRHTTEFRASLGPISVKQEYLTSTFSCCHKQSHLFVSQPDRLIKFQNCLRKFNFEITILSVQISQNLNTIQRIIRINRVVIKYILLSVFRYSRSVYDKNSAKIARITNFSGYASRKRPFATYFHVSSLSCRSNFAASFDFSGIPQCARRTASLL